MTPADKKKTSKRNKKVGNKKSHAEKVAKVQDRALEAMLKEPFKEKTVTDIQKEMKRQQRYGLKVYVSQWGDTLSQLAQATKKDVLQLIDENDLEYEDRLNTGTILKNLWPVKGGSDQEKAQDSKTSDEEASPDQEPTAKPQVRMLNQGVQARQANQESSQPDDEESSVRVAKQPKKSESVMSDKVFLDLVNRERHHYGLVNLKGLDHKHGFLIRALSDQSLIYSYQDSDGRLVTELALRLNDLDKPLDEAEAYRLISRQPLFYQQILQGLYRYQDFDLTYDKVNKTCQVYYALLTETQTD
ncbi:MULTISPECIES: LysM peptidoglycan-binding domain-containing protein [Aerococcus]|uniref:LysM peptidoglycan-binding domain-containing protein n=1 Tax=Aerococcus TaxID=1375 RepID=UPI0018A7B36A|nr:MULTISPECIES: LysM peptidoglycan-binding domain-containing protein [Aerococcus]MCY3036448.1 LysM peptidoglycan-binding domain-containing protein [Aerococcus sp. Group 2]MCY3039409.1 LysM peptidoglycan-binding domain-containing protein [Aerococcus sp. Group 2]MCY3041311.1 LysM peptidoglycan-binding domain-containing protein [Aerococcus sp. Group 2]MCY3042863.1 LysM peptidoglycan-binding domain-containing protein [Aerococcus sp. Group 2]MDK6520774.1 LysM peptidoglycan-binding domain-containin